MHLGTTQETQDAADEFARRQGMSANDLSLVDKFKSKVANFTELLSNLQNREIDAARYPDLSATRDELTSRGSTIKNMITSITGTIDKVFGFFRGITGMDGLGIVPLLPIAAITIAVAAITKWTTDAYEFSKRVDAIQALEAKGYDPVKAGQIVNQQFPTSSLLGNFGSISSLIPWIAIAGVIFYVIKSGKLK